VPGKVQQALTSVLNKCAVESFAKGLTDMRVTVISTVAPRICSGTPASQ